MKPVPNSLRIALVASVLLAGCEQKQSSNPADSGGTNPSPVSGAPIYGFRRAQIRESLQSLMDSVYAVNPKGINQAVLKFFRSTPEFAVAGIESDSSVYGVFADGRVVIFSDNVPPLTSAPPSSQRTSLRKRGPAGSNSIFDLPGGKKALFLYSMFSDTSNLSFAAWDEYMAEKLESIFSGVSGAYDFSEFYPGSVWLKTNVSNISVFHWSTHGGRGRLVDDKTVVYSLMTPTVVTNAMDSTLSKEDLDAGRLTWFCGGAKPGANGKVKSVWYYGITQEFIKKYFSFTANSIVMISACNSYNDVMLDAFKTAGASVYLGWDRSVGIKGSDIASIFFFDRCLGANTYDPIPVPPQRPFAWQYVYDDMQIRGLTLVGGDAKLKAQQFSGNLSVLLPSIKLSSFTLYSTYQKLNLEGDWGSVPGKVFLNGLPLSPSKPWKEGSLEMDMPTGGGNLQVVVDGRSSNVVQLSEYRATFTYTETGQGTLQKKLVANINFLADVHKFRVVSGANQFYEDKAVFAGPRIVAVLPSSSCTYQCSGSYQGISWSGSGGFANLLPVPTADVPGGSFYGTIGDEGEKATFYIYIQAPYTLTSSGGSSQQHFSTGDGTMNPYLVPVTIGETLQASKITKKGSTSTYSMEWGDIVPRYSPDPAAAR